MEISPKCSTGSVLVRGFEHSPRETATHRSANKQHAGKGDEAVSHRGVSYLGIAIARHPAALERTVGSVASSMSTFLSADGHCAVSLHR